LRLGPSMKRLHASLALITAITASGIPARAAWVTNGVGVCTASGTQTVPQLTPDGSRGVVILWEDSRTYYRNIYVQRVDASGAPRWTANGVVLAPFAAHQLLAQLCPDGSGGAIIAWEDVRNGAANKDIFAQRVNASGTPLWTATGVPVCTVPGDQSGLKVVPDGAGGAIIAWTDSRTGGIADIYAQRLNASGTPLWTADGVVVCDASDTQGALELTTDGAGGAIATWLDFRDLALTSQDLYAQRINGSGTRLWATDGVPVCNHSGNQTRPRMIPAGGGALVTWFDDRGGTSDIYAQKISSSGARLWAADGEPVCTAAASQTNAELTTDGAGGAIITWQDLRNGNSDIYAQRLNGTGAPQWAADGIPVSAAANDEVTPSLVTIGAGGAAIAWQEVRPNGDTDVLAQRIAASGNMDGATTTICTAAHVQGPPRMTTDGASGAILTWYDNRAQDPDIYAQRMDTPTPVTVQEFMAATTSDGVMLSWGLTAEAVQTYEWIRVQRAHDPKGPWLDVTTLAAERSMSFEDTEVQPGETYWYRLLLTSQDGVVESAALSVVYSDSGARTLLYPPIESTDGVVIRYSLAAAGQPRIEIFDVAGRRVCTLAQNLSSPGEHLTTWDRKGESGVRAARGTYVVRLRAGSVATTRKLTLLR
jgi:hypothetical protein